MLQHESQCILHMFGTACTLLWGTLHVFPLHWVHLVLCHRARQTWTYVLWNRIGIQHICQVPAPTSTSHLPQDYTLPALLLELPLRILHAGQGQLVQKWFLWCPRGWMQPTEAGAPPCASTAYLREGANMIYGIFATFWGWQRDLRSWLHPKNSRGSKNSSWPNCAKSCWKIWLQIRQPFKSSTNIITNIKAKILSPSFPSVRVCAVN